MQAPSGVRLRDRLRLVRVRGLRRTARAVMQGYVLSCRRWYLVYRRMEPGAVPPADPEFEYRLATASDLESLAVFEPNRHRREFRTWLEEGAFVFVAFHKGRPVAFQCFRESVPTGPPLSRLRLEPGQIWSVDVQTLPEYRRHHVASTLRTYRDAFLGARGIREYVSSIQDDNLPALAYSYRGREHLVHRVDLLHWWCVLGFRRMHIERDARTRLERRLAEASPANTAQTHRR